MMSIEEQIDAMRHHWPEFVVSKCAAREVIWEGALSPVKRVHHIRIQYRLPLLVEQFTIHQIQPRVQVLHPILERHPEYDQGPIPHVYINPSEPELPYLCLFSSSLVEWEMNDPIAETTVKWAARWLLFYEGWLVTKKWRGGGRHQSVVTTEVKSLAAV